MCWHICNNCNDIYYRTIREGDDPAPRPCIWFIPGVDESGAHGCPYGIDTDNDTIDPACWISVPFSKIQELIKKYPICYGEKSDEGLDEEKLNYKDHQEAIKRMIS